MESSTLLPKHLTGSLEFQYPAAQTTFKQVTAMPAQEITVLLIDDQAIVSEVVRRSLALEQDITFQYCSDPTQAIQTAIEIQPTVILQDLIMPEVDGLMLLRWFRQNPATQHIPMIVLSNKEDAMMKAEAFTNGANDYLIKLPDPIELVARIRYHSQAYNNYKALLNSTTIAQQQAQKLEIALNELQETQAQLIQTEKMSGLGQMVAGIAHEINNPVNFIHGNVKHVYSNVEDLLSIIELYQQNSPDLSADVQEQLENYDLEFLAEDSLKAIGSMRTGAERITEIVKSLRNFARLDQADQKEVNIHEGIDSTIVLLEHRINDHMKIDLQFATLPKIQCYPAQLNQVFMHLLNNAIDAIKERQQQEHTIDGKITIETSLLGNDLIEIKVSDNGIGIPDKIKNQIFNPFFTTKSVDTGKGLGLSICYRVIQSHNGTIDITSLPNSATMVSLILPVHQAGF